MLYSLARPLLFTLEPETAHRLTLGLAEMSAKLRIPARVPAAPVRAMGIDFPNPVGAAAGLDKHADHVNALVALGFGFVELGGVTPRPQPGNPPPRLFRIPQARAIINRYGLNSIGVDAVAENLRRAQPRAVIGVNVGKNRDTPNEHAVEDYVRCLEVLYPQVHYVTINVSSPNTHGLRELQSAGPLSLLLRALRERRDRLRDALGRHVALVLKISPDGDEAELHSIADVVRRERIDGLIATNTTLSREGVAGLRHAAEDGGLSGAPLFRRSTEVLHSLAEMLAGEVTLIGGGGILSGADAAAKFAAGATLVQIYSGLVFRGPRLIRECVSAYEAQRRSAH
jgi:dihydroorotate dehydrogenase